MAEKVKSMFGVYADKMQVVVDKSLDLFAPVWFKKYFDWGTPTTALTFISVIGRSRVEAAASIVERNSPAPIRSRAGLEKLSGSVPAIKESFRMNEEDYRNYLTVQNMTLSDEAKRNMVLDLMFGELKKAGDAPLKRIDIMVLQALSLGKVTVNATNNPDGLILTDIDLLMPVTNYRKPVVVWSSTGTSTPITDIKGIVHDADARGITFEKMLMTPSKFWQFQQSAETIKMLNAFYRLDSKAQTVATLEQINVFLAANMFPQIEIVNVSVGVEKDGITSVYKPFNDASVTFIPSGKLGLIHNAFAIEQMVPVQGINYATYEKVLLKKYAQHNPWAEFTDCELNAFPGLEAIDRIYILDSETAA